MEEYGANLRVYDLVCEGRFKPVDTFYTKEFLLDRAHKSVAMEAERVKDDPNRPAYHFQPPANWNNDPNGMLFYEDYYHMFYQHNPYGDRWDWMHWGHARSKDLVHWEHMPIALWPSVQKGENHCFSGSGYIKDDGKPILFYTSIGHEDPEHWAALPLDKDLKDWEKHPANPIIVMEDHDSQYIEDWRDPFLFREGNDTYMVIGGHPEDESGSIMMYKALNPELTEWDFLGTPFTGEEGNWECPNFFKVGDKYVLIYSPHGRVEYYTGIMDFNMFKFTPEYHGSIDNGAEWNYYAPNTLQKEDGRRILFGWIPGFKEDQGWQGAISLPRELSIDEGGRLIQRPVPELKGIRGELVSETNVGLLDSSKKLDVHYPQFEMVVNITQSGTDHIGFRFNDESGTPYEIVLTPETISFGDETVAVDPRLNDNIQNVHLFFDRTIIEIFVNDGLLCATKVIYADMDSLNFEVFSRGDEVTIDSIHVWEMSSIW
jgi:beta-fructofuranosidase